MVVATAHQVIPFEGEFDLHVSPRLSLSLEELIFKHPAKLVVDLSRVTYIDSSGLAVLIRGMQAVNEYGGQFALAGIQESVRSIFHVARLTEVFRIFPDVNAALSAD